MSIQVIKTMNSTYEVDLAQNAVRRTEGKNDSLMPLGDNEWHPLAETGKFPYRDEGYYYVFYFAKPDQGYLRTSLVQSIEEVLA